ncbi:MAG: hypothetical protein H7202_07445 [Pedobacter sp.]|nr:hypothetical protein [Pedobacter sp.]
MNSKNAVVIFTIALLLLICPALKAQEIAKPVEIKSLTKIRLTSFGAGLEREQKIDSLHSIYVGASISAVFPFESRYLGVGRAPDIPLLNNVLAITPVFYTGFRRYYNLSERKENSKKTINNSANYFGCKIDAIPPTTSPNGKYKTLFAMSLAPHWGMQRSLGEKVNFEFTFGPAIKTDFETVRIVPFSKTGFTFLL